MYHFIVRQTITRAFRNLSEGNYEAVLEDLAQHGMDEAVALPIRD